jgi:epoxyqueuosine reductase QueG
MQTDHSIERRVEQIVRDAAARCRANVLQGFRGEPAWGRPMVGVASGDDPLFAFLKDDIGEFYWTPREIFDLTFAESDGERARDDERAREVEPRPLSVVSWVLPQTAATKADQRRARRAPAERWVASRAYWPEVTEEMHAAVVAALGELGMRAVAPELSPHWATETSEKYGHASRWSQRHTAHVAGLGTFGLSDGLITPVGKAMRAGSVVVEAALEPTPRHYAGHLDWCAFHVDGSCGECIARCPAGAITREGHDKAKCEAYIGMVADARVKRALGERTAGCGLCQSAVQCESGVPASIRT